MRASPGQAFALLAVLLPAALGGCAVAPVDSQLAQDTGAVWGMEDGHLAARAACGRPDPDITPAYAGRPGQRARIAPGDEGGFGLAYQGWYAESYAVTGLEDCRQGRPLSPAERRHLADFILRVRAMTDRLQLRNPGRAAEDASGPGQPVAESQPREAEGYGRDAERRDSDRRDRERRGQQERRQRDERQRGEQRQQGEQQRQRQDERRAQEQRAQEQRAQEQRAQEQRAREQEQRQRQAQQPARQEPRPEPHREPRQEPRREQHQEPRREPHHEQHQDSDAHRHHHPP